MLERVRFLLLFVVSSIHLSRCMATRWQDCAPAGSPLRIEDVVLTPEKPVRGHPLVVIIKASMSGHAKQVEQGQISATVYYLGVPVYKHSAELCNNLPRGCPILPFDRVELNSTQAMPGWAPTGSYSLRFEGKTLQPCSSTQEEKGVDALDDEECVLLCADVWFSMHSSKEQDDLGLLADEDEHHDDHIDPV